MVAAIINRYFEPMLFKVAKPQLLYSWIFEKNTPQCVSVYCSLTKKFRSWLCLTLVFVICWTEPKDFSSCKTFVQTLFLCPAPCSTQTISKSRADAYNLVSFKPCFMCFSFSLFNTFAVSCCSKHVFFIKFSTRRQANGSLRNYGQGKKKVSPL